MLSSHVLMRRRARTWARFLVAFLILAIAFPFSPAQAELLADKAPESLRDAISFLDGLDSMLAKSSDVARTQRFEDPSQKAQKVVSLKLCPLRLILFVEESFTLVPLALDNKGEAVNGVAVKWVSSNPQVATVTSFGEVRAITVGQAAITVEAGAARKIVMVKVQEGRRVTQNDTEYDLEHDNDCAEAGSPVSTLPQSPLADETPEATAPEAASPFNVVGNPAYSPQERSQSSASDTSNNLGSANFLFSAPVLSLGGRGVGVNLALNYNSRLWSRDSGKMIFDINKGQPTWGWTANLGRILPNYDNTASGSNPGNYLLIQPDGTRVHLKSFQQSPGVWRHKSTDGSFLQYNSNTGKLKSPDGTLINFNNINNRRLPTSIENRNGDMITIAYRQHSSSSLVVS